MRALLRTLATVAALLLASCEPAPSVTRDTDSIAFRTDTGAAAYFGPIRSGMDSLMLSYFSHGLHGMDEPPLRGAHIGVGVTVMRFSWHPAFGDPVAVRVTRSAQGCELVTTIRPNDMLMLPELSPDGTRHPSTVTPPTTVRRDSTMVAGSTCADLAARMDQLPLRADGPYAWGGGPDGAEWVFERLDARGAATFVSWSPNCDTCATWTTGRAFLVAANAMPVRPIGLY